MPDPETTVEKKDTPLGFDKPLARNRPGKLPDHIAEDTRMAKGITPDKKEMVTVNLDTMKAKFGPKEGLDRYKRIAKAGGFFDPDSEPTGSNYLPDLNLEGMDRDARAAVDAILNEPKE